MNTVHRQSLLAGEMSSRLYRCDAPCEEVRRTSREQFLRNALRLASIPPAMKFWSRRKDRADVGGFDRCLKSIVAISLLAFLVRMGMFALLIRHPERAYRRDTTSYVRPALNLLAGNGFSQRTEPPFVPDVCRTPAYPLFIAFLYQLFGRNVLFIAGVQVLVGTLTVTLTYALGRRLLSERAATTGGVLMALSLGSAVYCAFVLTETLFSFLLLGAVFCLLLYRRSGRVWAAIVGGLLSGASILCRPIALFYPLLAAPCVGVATRGRWLRRVLVTLAFLVATGAVVAPWIVRNYQLVGMPVLSSISHYNLLFYNAVALEANLRGEQESAVRSEMLAQVREELRQNEQVDEGTRIAFYKRRGIEIILAHPLRYLIVHLRQDLNNLLPNVTEFLELAGLTEGNKGTLSVLNRYGPIAAMRHYFAGREWALPVLIPTSFLLFLVYLGAAVGLAMLWSQHKWFALCLLLLPTLYFLLIPGAPSHPRFRVPVMPYLCLLAGMGLSQLHTWATRRASRGGRSPITPEKPLVRRPRMGYKRTNHEPT